ncbi:TPM domain-containing protein [Candidatus Woesearchaeota archaeon]|nr:TPM domain-containing protein [Candidatus Woesearchaeota archaeon]
MRKEFLVLVLIISLSIASAAELPNWQDKYVNDFAGIFNASQVSEVRGLLAAVDGSTTAEIVVVTAPECTPFGGAEQYAYNIAIKWGIGKKEKDNGFLILYCRAENRIRGEVGRGLEGILPDSKVGRLLDEEYVPLKNRGDAAGGIISFTKAVASVVEENKEEVIAGKTGPTRFSYLLFFIIAFFFIILLFSIGSRSVDDKSIHGIKNSRAYNFVTGFISIVFAGILFFTVNPVFGVAAYFILNAIFKAIKGIKCEKDGLRMEKIGRKGNRNFYKCPNEHVGWILAAATAGYWIGHGLSGGGFSGGGFSGGGGFGGGGFSGGGASR